MDGSQSCDGAGMPSLSSLEEKQHIEADGAGASPLTSLEEKQADLREELNGKDCEKEQLKRVVNQKELLNEQQLKETIRRLNSEVNKTHSVVSAATVLTGTVEQLRSKLDKEAAEVRRLSFCLFYASSIFDLSMNLRFVFTICLDYIYSLWYSTFLGK